MPTTEFQQRLLCNVHPSWTDLISSALEKMDPVFLKRLEDNPDQWLPGADLCLAAFSVPRDDVKVVWLGESPYPRKQSANGLSFCDASVQNMFDADGGLSPMGSSLRNILKAWFVAIGKLDAAETDQEHIREMDRGGLVRRVCELFQRGKERGWLWLNASLSFWSINDGTTPGLSMQICKWLPLIESVLIDVGKRESRIVLLGEKAKEFGYLLDEPLVGPHPAATGSKGEGPPFISDMSVRNFLREWRCLIEREVG